MIYCEKCRALEFISDGIKRGTVVDIVISEPRYNCALGNKILLDENKSPYCENCKEKTTRVNK